MKCWVLWSNPQSFPSFRILSLWRLQLVEGFTCSDNERFYVWSVQDLFSYLVFKIRWMRTPSLRTSSIRYCHWRGTQASYELELVVLRGLLIKVPLCLRRSPTKLLPMLIPLFSTEWNIGGIVTYKTHSYSVSSLCRTVGFSHLFWNCLLY